MTTSAQIPSLFRADVVIGPYRRVFDKLEFEYPIKFLYSYCVFGDFLIQ
jgi:hypothetical protein